jgi:putative transposase
MRRNILDMGWYDLQQKVLKKSEKTDRNVLFIDPAYTSKTCNNCGHVNMDLTLKDRNCTCPKCGVSYNRDENAAKNIKDKYFKVGVYQEVL